MRKMILISSAIISVNSLFNITRTQRDLTQSEELYIMMNGNQNWAPCALIWKFLVSVDEGQTFVTDKVGELICSEALIYTERSFALPLPTNKDEFLLNVEQLKLFLGQFMLCFHRRQNSGSEAVCKQCCVQL